MRTRDLLILLGLVAVWSAVGGGLLVSKVFSTRGTIVIERVVYRDHPFMAEVTKYQGLMDKMGLTERLTVKATVAQPDVSQRTAERKSTVNLPTRRPSRHESPDRGRKLEDVIALAEAGL